MPPLPKNVLYYGTEAALPEQVELQAGPLSVLFEDGGLRYIRYGDREVVRRIYVAVRDRNWGTVLPLLSNLKIERTADTFQITYDCQHQQGGIDFFWNATIRGEANGSIRFVMDGEARTTFQRNRIGFACCIRFANVPACLAALRRSTARSRRRCFQKGFRRISPSRICARFRTKWFRVWKRRCDFTGETFEIEDHRNWTDASYKIYGTPLACRFQSKSAGNEGHSIRYGHAQGKTIGTEKGSRNRDSELRRRAFREPSAASGRPWSSQSWRAAEPARDRAPQSLGTGASAGRLGLVSARISGAFAAGRS